MFNRINYRRDLLQVVEAFLEKTPSATIHAQQIVEHCRTALYDEFDGETIDQLIWGGILGALTDTMFYESETYLHETRQFLLGHSLKNMVRAIISEDYRPYFTRDEAEWYRQLLDMTVFLIAFPFAKIHELFLLTQQQKDSSLDLIHALSEAKELEEKGEEEYQRRKDLIAALFARIPLSDNIGDEKVHHMVLREVMNIVTGIRLERSASLYGHPTALPPFVGEGNKIDMSESIVWAQRALNAIAGNGTILLSWRLSKALTFDADVLLVSLH
jgi:hypothetical protein